MFNTNQNPYLSVIIPVYNEQSRITYTLEKLTSFLNEQTFKWQILIINDGSTDNTENIVEEWMQKDPRILIESIPHQGKGIAIKTGMLSSSGSYRFMCDADLAMPINELSKFLEAAEKNYDIVIGSRQISGSNRIGEPLLRHIMGRVFNILTRLLLIPGIHDTQCGFKCFSAKAANQIFPAQKIKGFAFDTEILYLAYQRKLSICEIPITWHHHSDSKVNIIKDSIMMFKDILLIRLRI